MNKTLSMVNIVSLKKTIESLMVTESESIAVITLCKEFLGKLNEGVSETVLCESFIVELSKVAHTTETKDVVSKLTESVRINETNIKLANSVEALKNGPCMFVAPMIESAVVDYITNKNSETRDNLRVSVSLFENEANVINILETLNYETYQEKNGVKLNNATLKESVKPVERVYTQEEVDAIIESKSVETVTEPVKKSYKDIRTNIGLDGSIKKIITECKNNEKLKVFCAQFINALNEGRSEESICEAFISGIGNWNYLSAVDTELSALSDRVKKYKQEIDFKKIMETMLQTSSYYIVPLIEDCIVEYVDNKNMQTRGAMLQRLYSFEYDPFVRDIITLVTRDLSIDNTVNLGESLAETFTTTEYIYSPIQYIKENECVFNVKGSYFVRKGNSISKLSKKAVAELSESFKALCNVVNSGNVVFSIIDDSATVYDGYNMAIITESEITINNKKVVVSDIDNLYESAVMMNSDEKNFYGLVKIINENYNEIAYIDFVKRVSSKDGSGKAVDVFKIKNNIFVNTVNENLGLSTFYRNVNPIQCRNYINEHMEINVAPLFEDVLPEQEKVKSDIEAKGKEFDNYKQELKEKRESLLSMKTEANSKDIDDAIAMIDKEIEDVENDQEKYQQEVDKFLNGDAKDKEDSLDDEVPTDDADKDNDSDDIENREPNETPAEMEVPIEQSTIDSMDMPFDDTEFADVAYFDSDFDAPAIDSKGDNSFDVVKVSYNRNIKTGEYTGKGEVLVVIPSVDANGDVHNETRKVAFYIDSTSDDKKVVINNDYMPLDMYLAIQDAIENCPETDTINLTSPLNTTVDASTDTMDVDIDDVDVDVVSDDKSDNEIEDVNVDTVKVETPAETQTKTSATKYPISVGLYPDEIAPIDMKDFEKSLDDMGIKHSESEAADGEVIMEIANKSQAYALKKYFKEWKEYDDDKFGRFFPEMKDCFRNINEGVSINRVKAITESRNPFSVTLPANETYYKMFGIESNSACDYLHLIAESEDEAYKMYERLYVYARKNNYDVEQDVLDILERYETKYFDAVNESVTYLLNLPYNGFLLEKLSCKGFDVNGNGQDMSVEIFKDDYTKIKKILESFYESNEIPNTVSEFLKNTSLNEAVTITIRDDKSGKTVEINTDDALEGKIGDNGVTDESADFSSSFDNVTFKPEDTLAFNDDKEEDDDDDEDDKKDNEQLDTKDDQESDGEDVTEDEKDSDDKHEESATDKPKKKFKFKSKKKNESIEYDANIKLNENSLASVLDFVKVKSNNKKGQIVGQLADDNVIVNVDGHTMVLSTNEVELLNPKCDTLPPHMKFDPVTLKGIFESYIGCGLFINNMRITPNDCQVKIQEYYSTPENKEVELVIEGVKTPALKKYIQLTENINDVIDIANYEPGKMNINNESVNVLIHKGDYMNYKNVNESYGAVKTLVFDNNGETSMILAPGNSLRLSKNDDVYIPEYIQSLNVAVDTLLS